MEILFWIWFILLHCVFTVLLFQWDKEKTKKVSLQVECIRLTSEGDSIKAELKSIQAKATVVDPFKDWEEICLVDLCAIDPDQFMDMVSEDLRLREIVLASTVRIRFKGHIWVNKALANGKYFAEWENVFYEGAPGTCIGALKAFLVSNHVYYSSIGTKGVSGVVRFYKKKEDKV